MINSTQVEREEREEELDDEGGSADFLCGFFLGFFLGLLALLYLWERSVPIRRKTGIIAGAGLQAVLHSFRSTSY